MPVQNYLTFVNTNLYFCFCLFLVQSKDQDKVMIPGDPERAHMEKCDKLGGIEYHPNQIDFAVRFYFRFCYCHSVRNDICL